MACWSAENATRAYLQVLKMGKRGKEPESAEFISALAAGSNAQLMVMACASTAGSSELLSLVAAASQTGGRVACVVRGEEEMRVARDALGRYGKRVDIRVGDAGALLRGEYKGADFVLVDCGMDDFEGVFRAAQESGTAGRNGTSLVVGYNALRNHKGTCRGRDLGLGVLEGGHFLPIGEGLVVTRIGPACSTTATSRSNNNNNNKAGRRSRWVVTVDKCTGEEHVFRVGLPREKKIYS